MSRLLTTLLALIIAVTAIQISDAQAAPRNKTVASEWKETITTRRGTTMRQMRAGKQESSYLSEIHQAAHPFSAVGPNWKAVIPEGAEVVIAVRLSADGQTWRPWQVVPENHGDEKRDKNGRTFGSLIVSETAQYAQYSVRTSPSPEGKWPKVSDVTLTYIDASAGPTTQEAQSSAVGGYQAMGVSKPAIISRAGWGADESYRFDSSGNEIWDREYLQVTKAVLHDTVTRNNDPDPARTVRSIYYYHAVTRGWGDIGYNYLIDEQGRIYEGRAGGKNVVAGHALCYNFGTVGIAALGWHGKALSDGTSEGIPPTDAMVRAFERLIAWQFDMHGIDPQGRGIFMKRNIEPHADLPNILGHIDTSKSSVPCNNTHVDPGVYLYNKFDTIRTNVATLMGYRPVPKPMIQSVKFSPLSLYAGDKLRVDVSLYNAGTGLMETQGPNPYTVYLESQDWIDLNYPKVTGKYRILVDQSNNPTGNPSPYRFGLGSPLLAGQTRTISGFVTLPRAGKSTWWVGLNKEGVSTLASQTGTTEVTVLESGTPAPTATGFSRVPARISPNGDKVQDSTLIKTGFSQPVSWSFDIISSAGVTVRRFTGSGTSATFRWYGWTNAGQIAPNGRYTYKLTYKNSEGDIGLPIQGYLWVDTVKPQLSSPVASGFGPYNLQLKLSESATLSPVILNSSGTQVVALPKVVRAGGTRVVSWDGSLAPGKFASAGTYYWNVYGTDLAGNKAPSYVSAKFTVLPSNRVVDNASAAYSASSNWQVGKYGTPYAGNYEYRRADGSAADPALFKTLLSAGTYDVYAWYTPGTNRATTARYIISTSGGARTVTVNQQLEGNTWKLLGRFTLGSAANSVSLSAANGMSGYLIADAVRWVRR